MFIQAVEVAHILVLQEYAVECIGAVVRAFPMLRMYGCVNTHGTGMALSYHPSHLFHLRGIWDSLLHQLLHPANILNQRLIRVLSPQLHLTYDPHLIVHWQKLGPEAAYDILP